MNGQIWGKKSRMNYSLEWSEYQPFNTKGQLIFNFLERCKQSVITKSGCTSLVSVLKKRKRIRSQLGFLMEAALEWGDKLLEWKIVHTKRERKVQHMSSHNQHSERGIRRFGISRHLLVQSIYLLRMVINHFLRNISLSNYNKK